MFIQHSVELELHKLDMEFPSLMFFGNFVKINNIKISDNLY